jgi:uncharacterized protein (TIRG00374 family)
MSTDNGDQRKRSPWSGVVGTVLRVLLFLFIFGVILPLFIDYGAVFDAITGLSWWQFLVLLGLALLRVPTEALIYRALLPGLRITAGSECFLSQDFVGTITPPGGTSLVQYSYFRHEGFDHDQSLSAAIATFFFPTAGRMALPIVAFAFLLLAGEATTEALIIAGISIAVLAVGVVFLALIGRSDGTARWLGDHIGNLISWVLAKFNRGPVTDLGDRVVEFKGHILDMVRRRWKTGTIAVAANLFVTYLMFFAAVRFVGLGSDEVGWAQIFAVFAAALFSAVVIPITGNGIGTVDAVMIPALSTLTGGGDLPAAATFLWRAFYSFLTVPLGALTLMRFRRAEKRRAEAEEHGPVAPEIA